jgi:hypothetical protein
MGHGVKKGEVDSAFSARINDLEKKARAIADQFKNYNSPRPWFMPDTVEDPLDVPSLHAPTWERNGINQLYATEVLSGPGNKGGTVGDLIAMKWQADFMAAEERAFRTRHASLARCAALAHGRLDGHGKIGKSIFSFLKDAVQLHIDAGGRGGA